MHGGCTAWCARCFMARSASTYMCVVAGFSCPSHRAITVISTPACSICIAVECRLCLQRHSRHYVAFLTMLGEVGGVAGSAVNCGFESHRGTVNSRHSFPDTTGY